MELCLNKLLSTEITPIPRILNLYIGNYFDNAACNWATWLFVLLYMFHEIIDTLQSRYNEKRFKRDYLRVRMKRASWSFYWYTIALYFFSIIVIGDVRNMQKFNYKLVYRKSFSASLRFEFLGSFAFFLHSALWDLIKHGEILPAVNNILLSFVIISQYHFRTVSLYYKIMLVVCLRRCILEYVRLQSIFVISKSSYTYYVNYSMFITYFLISFAVHIYIIPFTIMIPFSQIAFEYNQSITLYLVFILWFISELADPVILKMSLNYLLGSTEDESMMEFNCCNSTIHSVIYPKFDDLFKSLVIREREIKRRREELMSRRKPKQSRMLLQTITCMAVLKKKLNNRRADVTRLSNGSKPNDDKQAGIEQTKDEKTEVTETLASNNLDDEEAVNGKLQIKITTESSGSVEEANANVVNDANNKKEEVNAESE